MWWPEGRRKIIIQENDTNQWYQSQLLGFGFDIFLFLPRTACRAGNAGMKLPLLSSANKVSLFQSPPALESTIERSSRTLLLTLGYVQVAYLPPILSKVVHRIISCYF